MNHAHRHHMTPRRMWTIALIGIGVMVFVAVVSG